MDFSALRENNCHPEILVFCDWKCRFSTMVLNHDWVKFWSDKSSQKLLFQWIWEQDGIYSYFEVPPLDWKKRLNELFQIQKQWLLSLNATELQSLQERNEFQVDVSVRFRPLKGYGNQEEADTPDKVVVPLHQRLQLIRAQYQCSPAVAQGILWGACDPSNTVNPVVNRSKHNPFKYAELVSTENDGNPDNDGCNITPTEIGKAPSSNLENDENGECQKLLAFETTEACVLSVEPQVIWMVVPRVGLRQFSFNNVFADRTSQETTYSSSARHIIEQFLNGVNGSIFCYGQTGSGKTHTMFGANSAASTTIYGSKGGQSFSGQEDAGIVPRACSEIINAVVKCQSLGEPCSLEVSYVEVYGDVVSDLLREGSVVTVWQGIAARSVLEGAAAHPVHSPEELQQLLCRGEANKRFAATAMNQRSSRAHSLLIFGLVRKPPGASEHLLRLGLTLSSRLCLADLGGSEQVKKSRAIDTSQRLQEAVQINLGLLALKNCISALLKRKSHIPYQDSMLTQLLQMALGGNSRTSVVITTSMEPRDAVETIQTLRFGERCARVKNKGTTQSQNLATDAIQAINNQLEVLQQQISSEERWEDGKPVGAEDLRARFEDLILHRKSLIGR